MSMVQRPGELLVIERAGHLFQEPGAREQLGEQAVRWFTSHFGLVGAGRA